MNLTDVATGMCVAPGTESRQIQVLIPSAWQLDREPARALNPFISFLRPIPALTFIPLIILYLGIGEVSKISVIWLAAFLYMTLYASSGVRNVPRDYLLLGQGDGLHR